MPDGVRLPGVGVVAQELRTAAPHAGELLGRQAKFHFSAKHIRSGTHLT